MDKIVLFKEFGRYCITPENNYSTYIKDAHKVSKFPLDCPKEDVLIALDRWGIANKDEIIDKTGE